MSLIKIKDGEYRLEGDCYDVIGFDSLEKVKTLHIGNTVTDLKYNCFSCYPNIENVIFDERITVLHVDSAAFSDSHIAYAVADKSTERECLLSFPNPILRPEEYIAFTAERDSLIGFSKPVSSSEERLQKHLDLSEAAYNFIAPSREKDMTITDGVITIPGYKAFFNLNEYYPKNSKIDTIIFDKELIDITTASSVPEHFFFSKIIVCDKAESLYVKHNNRYESLENIASENHSVIMSHKEYEIYQKMCQDKGEKINLYEAREILDSNIENAIETIIQNINSKKDNILENVEEYLQDDERVKLGVLSYAAKTHEFKLEDVSELKLNVLEKNTDYYNNLQNFIHCYEREPAMETAMEIK